MFKSLFKRIKSQKGMSGVLVALLLVVVGVGLVAGTKSYLDGQKTIIEGKATAAIVAATAPTP